MPLRQGEDTHLEDQGCSVNPKTRYAFCEHGLPTICPKTGIENVSVTLISFVAFSDTLVTAKPVVPYKDVAQGTTPAVAVQSTVASLNGMANSA